MLYLGNQEPALTEVLCDPIVRLLMMREGEKLDDVFACLDVARKCVFARSNTAFSPPPSGFDRPWLSWAR